MNVVPTTDPTLRKLVQTLGTARAATVISETFQALGLVELATPDDRFRFGAALMKRGGVLEAIGRSIKIQAILHGAKEE